jgi:hypothetical protein
MPPTDCNIPETCADCVQSYTPNPPPDTREAREVVKGMLRCQHLPGWQWLSPHAVCRFEPSRWEPRA